MLAAGPSREALSDRLIGRNSAILEIQADKAADWSTRTFQPRIPSLRSDADLVEDQLPRKVLAAIQGRRLQYRWSHSSFWRRSHSTVLCEGGEL